MRLVIGLDPTLPTTLRAKCHQRQISLHPMKVKSRIEFGLLDTVSLLSSYLQMPKVQKAQRIWETVVYMEGERISFQ